MADFLVHTIPGSPFGRAVLATLEEKGAAYRLAPVPPEGLKAPAHLARHPFGRIPVLQHGDVMLYETQAILRYLDRVLVTPLLTPSDPVAAARMDQAMNVNDWYLFQGVGNVIGFERVVAPQLMGRPADEAACAEAMPKARTVFQELSRLLGDQPYFAGRMVTLADLLVAPQLDILREAPEWGELAPLAPNLEPWLERMVARASLQRTTWARLADLAMAS
jgi:glutathione S-transferase